MRDGERISATLKAILSAGALLFFSGSAAAQVLQPTGESMPQPTGQAEIDVVTSRGFPADAVTLQGLFQYRGEAVNPITNAAIDPGAFSPLCGFTGELVLRGAGCAVALGWYNADSDTPPAANEIYVLVPPDPRDPMGYACQDGDFCPLATMNTSQTGQHTWTPRQYSADNIRSDQRYRGGLVGFALIGDQGTSCAQTKFSEAKLNTKDQASGKPWITALIWRSALTPDAFYVGFEDLPNTPETWKGQGGAYLNDGDFNDFVFFITGLTCKGGGQTCDTGLVGACAVGRTDCSDDGLSTTCRPVVNPADEACDNVDNDCNGLVDDGEGLCPDGYVCDKGSCVEACGTGEFRCDVNLVCESGFCLDPRCQALTCPEGQACRDGACVGVCDGVICPLGQECQLGRCIDLCAAVDCPAGRVCERGICVQDCSCRQCPDGTACAGDGRCVEPGCETANCGAGQLCVGGACVDPCQGAVCPGGAACVQGNCQAPQPGVDMGGGSGGTTGSGQGGSGISIDDPQSGTPGTGAGGPVTPGGTGRTGAPKGDSGCGCRVPAGPANGRLWFLGLGALGLGLFRRRCARQRCPWALLRKALAA